MDQVQAIVNQLIASKKLLGTMDLNIQQMQKQARQLIEDCCFFHDLFMRATKPQLYHATNSQCAAPYPVPGNGLLNRFPFPLSGQ